MLPFSKLLPHNTYEFTDKNTRNFSTFYPARLISTGSETDSFIYYKYKSQPAPVLITACINLARYISHIENDM